LTLTKKAGDSVNSITMVQSVGANVFNSFNVRCDMFGNISGNSTVKIVSSNINEDKRSIEGTIRLTISGTVEDYTISVIVTVWDIKENTITPVEPVPDDVVIYDGEWVLNKDNWRISLSSDVYLYDDVDGEAAKTFDIEKKVRADVKQMNIKVNGSSENVAQLGFNTINISFD
jgi:hypothetical protein